MEKKEIMNLAVNKARNNMNNNLGGPFGAAITKNGKLITVTSNTVLESHDPTCHAEINAIREAGKILQTHNLSECELYATGYPCPMCLGAIVWANIKKVYYGSDLQDATAIGFRDELFYDLIKNNNLKEIIDLQELNHQECVELLQEYKDNNKEMY
jgi:guanine deaminase